MEEVRHFDEHDRDRFSYYKAGAAWVCTEFVQTFEGIDHGVVRVLNGVFLCGSPEEEGLGRWTVEEYHAARCVEHGGRWFVDLVDV